MSQFVYLRSHYLETNSCPAGSWWGHGFEQGTYVQITRTWWHWHCLFWQKIIKEKVWTSIFDACHRTKKDIDKTLCWASSAVI